MELSYSYSLHWEGGEGGWEQNLSFLIRLNPKGKIVLPRIYPASQSYASVQHSYPNAPTAYSSIWSQLSDRGVAFLLTNIWKYLESSRNFFSVECFTGSSSLHLATSLLTSGMAFFSPSYFKNHFRGNRWTNHSQIPATNYIILIVNSLYL